MASAANVATSYSPGGANVHFYLAHGSFGPYMCPDPRRRLNRFSCFLRGSRLPVCPAEKYGTCDMCSNRPHLCDARDAT